MIGKLARSYAMMIAAFAELSSGIGVALTVARTQVNPINDDVDDPAILRRLLPLHYELYLKPSEMHPTKYGGSEAVRRTPTADDPRAVVAKSKVEEDAGLRAMWQ